MIMHELWGKRVAENSVYYSTIHGAEIRTVGSLFTTVRFTNDSLLRPLSSRTEHFRLVLRHCRHSSVLSVLSALLALFRCACVSSYSILVQFF